MDSSATSEGRRFTGRLFGPQLPGGGISAWGVWEGSVLRVTADRGEPWLADSPAVVTGGMNDGTLRLEWSTQEGRWALVLEGGEISRCRAGAAAPVASRIDAALARCGSGGKVFRVVLVLSLLAAILLTAVVVGFVAGSDRVARWVVDRIPPEQEARLGDLVVAQARHGMRLVDAGPEVDAIRTIGEPLTSGTKHRYRWFVAERPDVNAFAAPGGVVVVFRGLLERVETPEELAGVLAHEIAHAELRHTLMLLVKGMGVRALVTLLAGDVPGVDLGSRLMTLGFSRDAEREADREGLRRIVAARIDPAGMIRFYEKLGKLGGVELPPILSTHPATGERLDNLRKEAARERGPWRPIPVDPSVFAKRR